MCIPSFKILTSTISEKTLTQIFNVNMQYRKSIALNLAYEKSKYCALTAREIAC